MAGGGDGRHLGHQADRGQAALLGVFQVQVAVVEGGQRTEHAGHHRHRVRVVAEAVQEGAECLVHHRVVGDFVLELVELRGVRQLAVHQQVADFQEIGVLGQLLDRIAAIHQDAGVAVDVGDRAAAAGRRHEARVVGEVAGFLVELADVYARRTDRAGVHRQFHALAGGGEDHALVVRHDRLLGLHFAAGSGGARSPLPGCSTASPGRLQVSHRAIGQVSATEPGFGRKRQRPLGGRCRDESWVGPRAWPLTWRLRPWQLPAWPRHSACGTCRRDRWCPSASACRYRTGAKPRRLRP